MKAFHLAKYTCCQVNSRYWQLFLLTKFVCFVFSIGETWENVLTGHADVKEVCTNFFVLEQRKESYKLRSQILEQVKMCFKS